jgi:hypothetical protein
VTTIEETTIDESTCAIQETTFEETTCTFQDTTIEATMIQGTTIDETTVQETIVEVNLFDVETIQTDTVQVDTLGVNTVSTYEAREYFVSSGVVVQEDYGSEQADVGNVEEAELSVWYIPGPDVDESNPTHDHHAHHPPHQKPLVGHALQAISTYPKPSTKPHLATKSLAVPAQMDLVDMPAPRTIRPRRKAVPVTAFHEIIHP